MQSVFGIIVFVESASLANEGLFSNAVLHEIPDAWRNCRAGHL